MTQSSEKHDAKKELKSFDDRATKSHYEKEHHSFQTNLKAYENRIVKNVNKQEKILEHSLSPNT